MLRLLRRLPVLLSNSSPQPGLAAALSRRSYSGYYSSPQPGLAAALSRRSYSGYYSSPQPGLAAALSRRSYSCRYYSSPQPGFAAAPLPCYYSSLQPGLAAALSRRSYSGCYSSPQPVLAAVLSRRSYSSRYYSGRDTKTGLGILALIGGGCAAVSFYCGKHESVPITGRSHWLRFSPAAESMLGLAQLDRITNPLTHDNNFTKGIYVLPADHPDTVRVRLITENIITALRRTLVDGPSGSRPMPKHLEVPEWEVILLKSDLVEAYGLAGGKIVVYTGMLDCLSSDDEIAYLISHEVGHVVARHSAENMTSQWIFTIIHLFLRKYSLFSILSDKMAFVLNIESFPLEMEMEADHIGLSILVSAGYDLHAAMKAYTKISQCPYGSTSPYYLNRHPSDENRRALLSQGCDTIKSCCDNYQGPNTDIPLASGGEAMA